VAGGSDSFVVPNSGNRRPKLTCLALFLLFCIIPLAGKSYRAGSPKSFQPKLIPIKLCNSNLRLAKGTTCLWLLRKCINQCSKPKNLKVEVDFFVFLLIAIAGARRCLKPPIRDNLKLPSNCGAN